MLNSDLQGGGSYRWFVNSERDVEGDSCVIRRMTEKVVKVSGLWASPGHLSHLLQLIRPINALDELYRLMKSFVHPKAGAAGSLGAGLIPISSELCYRLGACQITMCGTGMQR